MAFAITPAPQATVPVEGGDPFPVRRIYCVGRNLRRRYGIILDVGCAG